MLRKSVVRLTDRSDMTLLFTIDAKQHNETTTKSFRNIELILVNLKVEFRKKG